MNTRIQDSGGYAVSGANAPGLELLERACAELRCFVGDPVATVRAALDRAPEMVMGQVLLAYLHLLGTEPGDIAVARQAHATAVTLPANDRERRHLEAIRLLAAGRWLDAGRVLEDLSIDHPRDALALQAGHQIDFFTGRSRMLRDRIARALPHWSPSQPGYHALLGMHAFGLEECGDHAAAEALGRRAVELEPRDGWAWHAVAHVMEMQGRARDGVAWMRSGVDSWAPDSFFAVHNWWHLALYHLELGEADEAIALFDGPIHGARSAVILDLIDASALLWRLGLRGVDVGERWQSVGELWAPLAEAGNYAFNDFHATMAFVGAARVHDLDRVLATQRRLLRGEIGRDGDNLMFTRDVGHDACRALQAFGAGDHDTALALLRPLREIAHRFGGSHAQRDLIDLTIFEAARRSGRATLVEALGAERSSARSARLGALPGALTAQLHRAEDRAEETACEATGTTWQ